MKMTIKNTRFSCGREISQVSPWFLGCFCGLGRFLGFSGYLKGDNLAGFRNSERVWRGFDDGI
jgi:hypothetical protein